MKASYVFPVALAVLAAACGGGSNHAHDLSQNRPPSQLVVPPGPSAPPSVASGPEHRQWLLRTTTEQSTGRSTMMDSRVVRAGAIQRFNVNTERSHSFNPKSPIIHTYHAVGALAPLAVKLSEDFVPSLPALVQNQLNSFPWVEHVDVLFTPQQEVREIDASLKAQYWMFPNQPRLDDIVGAPPEFQRNILMGIYESEHPIDGQVSSSIASFPVSLHDGLVSPDTGHLSIQSAPQGSFAFYSIVLFEAERRAAVTLHWMLTSADRHSLTEILVRSENHTLTELVHELNEPHSIFRGTGMMEKLNALVRNH